MSDKELATRQAAGAVANYDYSQDAGSGFENQTAEDRTIPFLAILQSNSPQVEAGDLTAGDLYNSATEETYKGEDGVVFVPGVTEHVYVEWVPRDQGGGFVARYELDDPFVAKCRANKGEFGKVRTPDGNDLQETFYVYGVVCPEGREPEVVVISFTSTKIKAYRQYFGNKLGAFTLLQGETKVKPPLFAHSVRIATFRDKNNKGSFYNFTLAPGSGSNIAEAMISPDDPRFLAAKACRELVSSGAATAAVEKQGDDTKTDSDSPF